MSKPQNHQLSEEVDFRPAPSISLQGIELEEAILGAILLDPDALAAVEGLSIKALTISAHQKIFACMLELHHSGTKPDLPSVAFRMAENGNLKSIGSQVKVAQLLDHITAADCTKQYAALQTNSCSPMSSLS